MEYCRNCGTKLIPGDAFCRSCGQRIGGQSSTPALRICENCGAILKEGDMQCPSCGHVLPVPQAPAAPVIQNVTPVPQPGTQRTGDSGNASYVFPSDDAPQKHTTKEAENAKTASSVIIIAILVIVCFGLGLGIKYQNDKLKEAEAQQMEEESDLQTDDPYGYEESAYVNDEDGVYTEEDLFDDTCRHYREFYIDYIDCLNRGDIYAVQHATTDVLDSMWSRYTRYNSGYRYTTTSIRIDRDSFSYRQLDDYVYAVNFIALMNNNTVRLQDNSAGSTSAAVTVSMEIDTEEDDWFVTYMEPYSGSTGSSKVEIYN